MITLNLKGEGGAVVLRSSGTATPATASIFEAIQMISDCTFTTLTASNWTGDTASLTFPAGTVIYGKFTAITIATGDCIAYRLT